jgi:diguanylate cyclase (GGDEF)-like protein/PAS domain S-box-containing protein
MSTAGEPTSARMPGSGAAGSGSAGSGSAGSGSAGSGSAGSSVDPLAALAGVTAVVRSPHPNLAALLVEVERATERGMGRRCTIWQISSDGTRMRSVGALDGSGRNDDRRPEDQRPEERRPDDRRPDDRRPDDRRPDDRRPDDRRPDDRRPELPADSDNRDDHGWQPASGPIADVLGARQAIEMGFAEQLERDRAEMKSSATNSQALTGPRSFARFVPVHNRGRIVAVIAIVRSADQPMFAAGDRVVIDAIVERIETAFAAQDLNDHIISARTSSFDQRGGGMLREELLNRLAGVSGDIAFRHRFGFGTEYVSAGVELSLGFRAEEFLADAALARRIIHPEDRHIISTLSDDPEVFTKPMLIRTIARDGTVAWQFVRMSPIEDNGRILGVEGLATDVSSMKRTEAELAIQARSDPLTGLANRLTFREFAQRSLARIERHAGMVGVLYLDLTGFKTINDTLGHAAGDQAIVMVAQRLIKVTRREDVVARLGGDEFAVLMPDLADVSEATATAQRIIGALEAPIHVDEQTANISTGIGVAVTTSGAMTSDELVNQADIALYQAKRAGRGRWQVYAGDNGNAMGPDNAGGAVPAAETVITAGMLRSALAAGDFRVHYLPIVDARTGESPAVEALVRWQHSELGLLPASVFIEQAQEADIIHVLGDWVLAQACRQIQQWRNDFGVELDININVTADQLAQEDFSESVLSTLASTGTSPRRLGIEVPEQVLASMTTPIESTLETLHRGGVRIIIDHFGSGSSSLRTLRRIPVDAIKLDRSIVDELDHATERAAADAEISGLAIKLASSLGADVVAVGIERAPQLARLAQMGCTLFQGSLATTSLTAEQLTAMVSSGRLSYSTTLNAAGWTIAPA